METCCYQEAQKILNLDGIYVIGHSNGGNMASELACKTDLIDGKPVPWDQLFTGSVISEILMLSPS